MCPSRKIPADWPVGRLFMLERGLWARRRADGSVVYGISYRLGRKLRRETIGPALRRARAELAARKTDRARGKLKADRQPKAPPFDEFAETYVEHARRSKRSWKTDEERLGPLKAFFGSTPLDQLTAWDIERFRTDKRDQGVTLATVNRYTSLLKRLFALAIQWGVIETSPAASIRLYKEEEKPVRVLSLADEKKLIAAAADHLKPLIIVALQTGLRRGELLGLWWEHVDLPGRLLTVARSKSGRVRHVPLNDIALDALQAIRGERDLGPVFTYRGRPVGKVWKAFAAAVDRAKIRHCRLHDLRHTYATRAAAAGVPVTTLQRLLGHASVQTTQRYTHPSRADLREAVFAVQEKFYGERTKV
jgi:integrase